MTVYQCEDELLVSLTFDRDSLQFASNDGSAEPLAVALLTRAKVRLRDSAIHQQDQVRCSHELRRVMQGLDFVRPCRGAVPNPGNVRHSYRFRN